ncbi:MAG: hypothetical protein STSR0008_16970 [Ignavibacterium sp.]
MRKLKIKDIPINQFPLFCDYSCKYAKFTSKDVIGDCRKELAVYCSFFSRRDGYPKKYNNKNSKCITHKSK